MYVLIGLSDEIEFGTQFEISDSTSGVIVKSVEQTVDNQAKTLCN